MVVKSDKDRSRKFTWEKGDVIIIRNGVAIDLDTGKPLDPQPQEVLDDIYSEKETPEDGQKGEDQDEKK